MLESIKDYLISILQRIGLLEKPQELTAAEKEAYMDVARKLNIYMSHEATATSWKNRKIDMEIPFTIYMCCRCGTEHKDLIFKPFSDYSASGEDDWTHWASCPNTGEPILANCRIVVDN